MKKLAVMVSGGGSNLQAIIDGCKAGSIDAQIAVVISSMPGVYALERAQKEGIPTVVIRKKDYAEQQDFFAANINELNKYSVDGIVLAGYMCILGSKLVNAYENKIINIHPSLIPSFCGKGYYGRHVHEAVINYGAKVSGATVHFVDEGADTGPIIMQRVVEVLDDDTPQALAGRILKIEHQIIVEAVALFCADKLEISGRRVIRRTL